MSIDRSAWLVIININVTIIAVNKQSSSGIAQTLPYPKLVCQCPLCCVFDTKNRMNVKFINAFP